MAHGLRVASVALANEQAGVTGAAVDMAVQYAKDRVQFGRPIGSFQAIKHKCADLHVALESAGAQPPAASRQRSPPRLGPTIFRSWPPSRRHSAARPVCWPATT